MTSVIERLGLWTPPYSIIIDALVVTCRKGDYEVRVPIGDWTKWRSGSGHLIQDLMPYLSAEQREFLISGTTPDEWASLYPKDDSE